MTVADSDRRTDAEKLLGALLEALGEGAIDTHLFESSRPEFDCFLNTSWSELEATEFIARTSVPPTFFYRLTPTGWVEALLRRGFLDDESVQGRLAELTATLKRKVKGRTASAVVDSIALRKKAAFHPDGSLTQSTLG